MNRKVVFLAALVAVPLAGCAQMQNMFGAAQPAAPPPRPAPLAPPPPPPPPPPPLASKDADFVRLASLGGNAEVQFAQLAQSKARRAAVHRFADMMVQDHSQANQELADIAHRHGIAVETGIDAAHQRQYAQLQQLTGGAFDRAYLRGQIADHVATLRLVREEARNGADPDLRGFADHLVPIIERHLRTARDLARPAGSTPPPPAPQH